MAILFTLMACQPAPHMEPTPEPVVESSIVMSVSAAGAQVAGSVSYDAGSRTVTFTPSEPLANSTE